MAKRVDKKTARKRKTSKVAGRKKASVAAKTAKSAAKPRKAKAAASKGSSTPAPKAAKRAAKSASSKKVKRAARTAAVREKTNTKVATKAGRARVTAEKTDTASHESSSTLSVIPFPGQEQPTPKTRLTPKQLEEFKRLLLEKRAELAGDVSHLAREMIDRNSQGPNEHTTMPIHMADVGSDNWEKEFTFGLIANEHERMREIDEALKRIEDGTYGVCLATHRRISVSRLRAKPWAKYCIEYARAREEGRAL